MRKLIAVALVMFVALLFVGVIARSEAQLNAAPPMVLEMTAKKYEFSPDEVHVKQGAHVQLKIRATDRTHGFKISLYPEGAPEKGEPGLRMAGGKNDFKLEENQEQIVEFVAERAGTYEFQCSVRCGLGHGHMKGKVVVE